MAKKTCSVLQGSLSWCEGTPEPAGIRRKLYYTSFGNLADYPKLPVDDIGRPTSSILQGEFVMKGDAVFHSIEFLPEKSTFTSESQGEYPSVTQLDKLTVVHPGVGPEAVAAMAFINNSRNCFLFQDKKGRWRMVGTPDFDDMKNTVAQDLGQGSAGTTSTTISVEASNLVSAPFFSGSIMTDEGEVDLSSDLIPAQPKQV
ncbi:MAG: hypothetical protein K2M45_08150 [Muribaculaceae bacterium]|nr:hypothetical protein [Muribaculaceae bacterium]